MHATHEGGSLYSRDSGFIDTDIRTVRWIAQAAVNVELFTIPLYMTTLYSLTGMHPITGQGNAFYKGRLWPGAKTSYFTETAKDQPGWANKEAYNIIFSVFIQEMLHLQMAANIATAIGAVPDFTDPALQDSENGWICYGKDLTVIPDIVDLRDTRTYKDVKVNVGPLDEDRIKLFLAIELPQEQAEADIEPGEKRKYFPKIPFDKGDPDFDPATAGIMFGSIGYMYQCYRDYLEIRYDDGSVLWDHVFNPKGVQNDLFNNFVAGNHPMREFMGFESTIALTDSGIAFKQALNMMNAITDQGEGATLKARLKVANAGMLKKSVEVQYRSDDDALKSDYPSYSDSGDQQPSADAAARYPNDAEDHYGRFQWVLGLMREGGIETWNQSPKVGNWTAADLTTPDFVADPTSKLPHPDQIAKALNNLNEKDVRDANFATLSQAVVGAIKGVTTVLNDYWAGTGSFPFPSMVGSGDRMSACWAAFGMTPDLSKGIPSPDTGVVNHACQGLSLTPERGSVGNNSCAETPIFHSCRGSNDCKGMGGCGFVQQTTGGGSCGGASSGCGTTVAAPALPQPAGGNCSAVRMRMSGGLCGGPTPTPSPSPTPTPTPTPAPKIYTAPSDNICKAYGGCAVPISACQVYPVAGTMDVYVLAAKSGCGTPTPTPTPSSCGTPTPTPHGCGAPEEANGAPGVKTKNLCGGPTPTPTPSSCSAPASKKIGTIEFAVGDRVEDVAFKAFQMVVAAKGMPVPDQPPPPNDLRLAFPPST